MQAVLQLKRVSGRSASKGAPEPAEKAEQDAKSASSGAHKYLEDHNLVSLTRVLLRDLVSERPSDPYSFLLNQLAAIDQDVIKAYTASGLGVVAAPACQPIAEHEAAGKSPPMEQSTGSMP